MKAIPALFLALLAWLSPTLAMAEDGLAEIAAAKRGAALKLSGRLGEEGKNSYGLGVFISADGLALVNLSDLALPQKPTIVTADGTKLPLGTILGIFPEAELALVKFKHQPKQWLPLAAKEPEIGEHIAIAGLCHENSWSEKVPPVLGPVMAKRSTVGGNLRELQFRRVISLGSGMSLLQKQSFGQGSFAVNRKGQLVAVKAGVRVMGPQMLVLLAPVSRLAEQVDKMVKEAKVIPFPLPAASNPIDPALLDPAYRHWDAAIHRGDRATALKYLGDLQKRYPENARVKMMTFDSLLTKEGQPVADIADLPKLDAQAPLTAQVERLQTRATFLVNAKQDIEGAIRELTAAVALCPKDFADLHVDLAKCHGQLGHEEVAEVLLREAYALEPENIALVGLLEKRLTQLGKFDEARKFTNQIYELESLCRSR